MTKKPPLNIPLNIKATDSAFAIYDPQNKRSALNMLPTALKNAVKRLPKRAVDQDLDTLSKRANPNATDARLKLALWTHLSHVEGLSDEAIQKGLGAITVLEWSKGICTPGYITNVLVRNPDKLAWLMIPAPDYELFMRECLELSLQSVRNILAMPEYTKDKNGKRVVDHRLIAHKIKLYDSIEARVKGPVQQRVQIDKRQLNVHTTSGLSTSNDLKELEAEIQKLQGLPAPVQDVIVEQSKEQTKELENNSKKDDIALDIIEEV